MSRSKIEVVCFTIGLMFAGGCGNTESDTSGVAGTSSGGESSKASGGSSQGGSQSGGGGSGGTGGALVAPACPAPGTLYWSGLQCSGGSGCELADSGVSIICDCVDGYWAQCRFQACPAICTSYGVICPSHATLPAGCACEPTPPPPNQNVGGCCCTQS